MNNLLQGFIDQLKAAIPQFLHIYPDWGQMDIDDALMPPGWPCILVDINKGTFSDHGNHQQQGLFTIIVRVFLLQANNAASFGDELPEDIVMNSSKLYKNIHLALHGKLFLDASYTSPQCISQEHIKHTNGLYEQQLTYTVMAIDNSSTSSLQMLDNAQLSIKV